MKWFKSAVFLCLMAFLLSSDSIGRSYAVDLAEFVIAPTGHTHTLSTGETIRYTDEGGAGPSGSSSAARMYKNDSYEQFFVGTDSIYRREDTSWAPVNWGPAHCGSDIAAYTVGSCRPSTGGTYTVGESITDDGISWISRNTSPGQIFDFNGFKIVPIIKDLASGGTRQYCTLTDLSGYPSDCTNSQIQFSVLYEPNEFTFCTGIKNEEQLAVLNIVNGPGAGDTFYYMKGWGLVGFEAAGFKAGLMGNGASTSNCTSVAAAGQTIKIKGQIVSTLSHTENGSTSTLGDGIKGATIAVSEGQKKEGSLILTSDPNQIVDTSSAEGQEGYFEITLKKNSGVGRKNYLIFMCGANIEQVGLIDTGQDFEGFYVYLPCDSGTVQDANAAHTALANLTDGKLTYLLKDNYLACRKTADLTSDVPGNILQGTLKLVANLVVQFVDAHHNGQPPTATNPPTGTETNPYEPTALEMDGRAALMRFFYPVYERFVANNCFFTGCPNGADESLRMNDVTNPSPLPSCEDLKDCNNPVSAVSSDVNKNQQTCGGTVNNLGDPFSAADKYKSVIDGLKDTEVCTDGGTTIKLGEIAPPDASWGQAPYVVKKDSQYFPYSYLYGGDKKGVQTRNDVDLKNDSVSSDATRDRLFVPGDKVRTLSITSFDANGLPLEQPKAFKSKAEYVIPGDAGSPKVEADLIPPTGTSPLTFAGDPKFDTSNTPNIGKEYSASSKVIYSVLALNSLCICGGFGEARDANGQCVEASNDFDNPAVLPNQKQDDSRIAPIYKYVSNAGNTSVFGFSVGNFIQSILNILSIFSRPWGTGDPDVDNPPGCTTQHIDTSWEEATGRQCGSRCDNKTCVVGNYEGDNCTVGCDAGNAGDPSCHVYRRRRSTGGEIDDRIEYQREIKTLTYGCSATIRNSLQVSAEAPKFNDNYVYAVNNIVHSFADPTQTDAQFGSTCSSDSAATNESDSQAGLGVETSCGPSSYNPLMGLQQAVGDPKFTNISFNPTKFGINATQVNASYGCDTSLYDNLGPPADEVDSQAQSYYDSYISYKLTPDLIQVYAEASHETGVPCEVLAGIHSIEGGNDPNRSLISGRPLGTPEPDQGGRVYDTLLETAIDAGNILVGKVGSDWGDWQHLVTALSRYNGGGNANCNGRLTNGYDYCPRLYEGEDDPYPVNWLDSPKHSSMYLLFCGDHQLCATAEPFERPGSATVSLMFHRQLTGH